MRIRTQLTVAFLLLAVLPLTGIVLFNYATSKQALEDATQVQADALARQMQERMVGLREDLARQTGMVGDGFGNFLRHQDPEEKERLAQLVEGLSSEEGMIESFVFVPREPPAPLAPPKPEEESTEFERLAAQKVLAEKQRQTYAIIQALHEQEKIVEINVAEVIRMARDEAAKELVQDDAPPFVQIGINAGMTWLAQMVEQHGADVSKLEQQLEESDEVSENEPQAEEEPVVPDRFPILPEPMTVMRLVDVEQTLEQDGRVIGHIAPRINAAAVVGHVLGRTDRERGEIPFAIDREGEIFTLEEKDQQTLVAAGLPVRWQEQQTKFHPKTDPNPGKDDLGIEDGLGIEDVLGSEDATPRGIVTQASFRLGEEWAVVTSVDPKSGLTWGIASPLGDSLEQLRTTTFRNFLTGLGLIALAMLGILPLSRRMTRHLDQVTAGAERIAHGDLDVRLPETSRDEFGKMARVFNRMAEDLKQQQSQLITEQRQRRAQEVEQRLLQVELERKGQELEEARRFQLSMLPKILPVTPLCDLAVEMRTATEVGGDYYDFAQHDDALTIAIGDATGHGATAGRMVTVVKSLFTAWEGQGELSAFLADMQRAIKRMDLGRLAMALALVQLAGHRLTVTSAGMPPLLIFRAKTRQIDEVEVAGMPLGGLDRSFSERHVEVESGDVVVLMTDGLPELPDSAGDPLGYEAVRTLLKQTCETDPSPDQIIAAFLDQLDQRTGGQPPNDDVTFIVLRIR